ncbi:MAG: ABC transporter permease [Coprococcus sp.]|nr:ABC transporter permease [Coprococcus sp.]
MSLLLIFLVNTFFFDYEMKGSFAIYFLSFVLVMLSMFSIGMMVGGVAPNTKIASTIASVLYFPMLVFSGATLPYEVMPAALQKCASFLPLTQGIKLLKNTSLGLPVENVVFPIILMGCISVVCIGIAVKFFKWE